MERKRSASGGGPGKKPKSKARRKTDLATTALGATPPKRGLKKTSAEGGLSKKSKTAASAARDTGVASGAGQRDLGVNVKTARQRTHSSTLWLHRQLNDPFVARAKAEGYRSRAAYKLQEINDKFGLIAHGSRVVDLGCAPGGWLQIAVKAGAEHVVGIDYLAMPAVPGATVLELDFLDDAAPDRLKAALGGAADVVLSDMAAPTTGHRATDHLRIIALADAALDFAIDVLAPGGAFVCKVFQGGAEGELLTRLKRYFVSVKHAKPRASRVDSAEMYVVATGFRQPPPGKDETA